MPARPQPPAHLPDDVKAIWVELVEDGVQTGPGFEAYCGQVARLRDAQRRLAAEGAIVADAKGSPIPHPALEIERRAQQEVRAWGNQFAPRGRLGRS